MMSYSLLRLSSDSHHAVKTCAFLSTSAVTAERNHQHYDPVREQSSANQLSTTLTSYNGDRVWRASERASA